MLCLVYFAVALKDDHIKDFALLIKNDFDLMIFLRHVLEESKYNRTVLYSRGSEGMPQIPGIAERSLLTWVLQQPNRAVAYTTLLERLEKLDKKYLASQLKSIFE